MKSGKISGQIRNITTPLTSTVHRHILQLFSITFDFKITDTTETGLDNDFLAPFNLDKEKKEICKNSLFAIISNVFYS